MTASVAILIGPRDVTLAEQTVPHILSVCSREISTKILLIDTLPCGESNVDRGTVVGQLQTLARKFVEQGFIDIVVRLDDFQHQRKDAIEKHFGHDLAWQRDFRGVPLLGWIAGIESGESQYHIHFDCDVLIHCKSGVDWVSEGVRLLNDYPQVLTVAPHPGPPHHHGKLHQPSQYHCLDSQLYTLNTFSSRRFIIDRRRLEQILPLRIRAASRRHQMRSWIFNESPLLTWELLMQNQMQKTGYLRGHFAEPYCWSLHIQGRSERLMANLPRIIDAVNRGHYPTSQAGHYDLMEEAWLNSNVELCGF